MIHFYTRILEAYMALTSMRIVALQAHIKWTYAVTLSNAAATIGSCLFLTNKMFEGSFFSHLETGSERVEKFRGPNRLV